MPLTGLWKNVIINIMELENYIEQNIQYFELIGNSTNNVYIINYLNNECIFKHCKMNNNNLPIFWSLLNQLFGHDFINQLNNLNNLYNKLLNNHIRIAKPLFIEPIKKYHVYEKIEGRNYSPDIFPDNHNIHFQLGKYIGNTHKTVYNNYGTIDCQNKHDFESEFFYVSKKIIQRYWRENKDVKKYFDKIHGYKIFLNNNSLIMPDISANQFVYSNDLDKINGLVDLDSYVIRPKELELTIIELCIPNKECADFFRKGYEQYNKLPLLGNNRNVYRFIIYICDLNNSERIEEFMNKNIYYE
jgi:hypothetical protein